MRPEGVSCDQRCEFNATSGHWLKLGERASELEPELAIQVNMKKPQVHTFITETGREYTLVPVQETAAILGMIVQGLGIWRNTNYGPASILIGRKRYYRSCDLDDFLNRFFDDAQAA